MAKVELNAISKAFGNIKAVNSTNIVFEEGSFTTLLGPSGCGKTTILRMIAGLETPSEGDLLIAGRRVNDVPVHRRNLGLVFQNYALFPHKTIAQNIAFGLKYRGASKAEIETRVKSALDMVRLPGLGNRYPSQLSGGQQQRIALARAIVIEPSVLLLDEPLSALDANLREEMRVELSAIQDRIGVTTVFVTHDQSEALAMSDRVIIMRAGQVEQEGSPEQVYNRPVSEFVARFLGVANILSATVCATTDERVSVGVAELGNLEISIPAGMYPSQGDSVNIMIRAEHLKLSAATGGSKEGKMQIEGEVEAVDYQGQLARYFVRVGSELLQTVEMIDNHVFSRGDRVVVQVRGEQCILLRR